MIWSDRFYYKDSFFDKKGLLHSDPGETGDNGLQHSIELAFAWFYKHSHNKAPIDLEVNIHKAIDDHQISPGVYCQTPYNREDPASHDIVTSIAAMSYVKDWQYHKEIKILGKFWHPRDVVFLSYLKYENWRWFIKLFFWILYLSHTLSFKKDHKKRDHGTFVHTDGKKLGLTRLWTLSRKSKYMGKCLKRCEKILSAKVRVYDYKRKRFADISTWYGVYNHYFKYQENHPLVRVWNY